MSLILVLGSAFGGESIRKEKDRVKWKKDKVWKKDKGKVGIKPGKV